MKPLIGLRTILYVIFYLILFSSSPSADVRVERTIKTGGVAPAEAHEVDYIKGALKRTDSKMKLTGRVIGMLIRPKNHSTIYHVEGDRVWEVNHAEKTYTERTISLSREGRSERAAGGEGWADGMKGRNEEEGDEVKILRNDPTVKGTRKKKTINGFSCRLYLMTWIVETENTRTKERNKYVMTGDFWNAPEEGPVLKLMREENTFRRAYLKKLGLEMTPGEMKKFGLEVIGGIMGTAAPELQKEMEKMKGYPIVTSIQWEAENKGKGKVPGSTGKKEGDLVLLFASYSEIEAIDTSTLSESHFEVPKEYRREPGTF